MPKVAVFGGSFNPPGQHHFLIVRELLERGGFNQVIVVPCGPRPDKLTTNDIDSVSRATMVDLTFRGLANVEVDLFDLENGTFTRTHQLDKRYGQRGDLWHVVGTDLISGGAVGQSQIQRVWKNGSEIWSSLQFLVLVRNGYKLNQADLPPRSQVQQLDLDGASSDIRTAAMNHRSLAGLVRPEVASYIERHELYRGSWPRRTTRLRLVQPQILVFHDQRNERAVEVAAALRRWESDDPNLVVAVGGDGTMLRAIHQHWQRHLPFIGINVGHRGFLLNNLEGDQLAEVVSQGLEVHRSPLLYVETVTNQGAEQRSLVANDAWVQCQPGTTGWLEVKIDGQVRLPRLVSDGVLVSTAAGSTAYARAMGATPIPVGTPELVLVGNNVLEPPNWRSAYLPLDSLIQIRSLDQARPTKRPILGFVDGLSLGEIRQLDIRASRIAAIELAFLPGYNLGHKLAEIQFPS